MRFENINVMNFNNAIRGMRNPKESYHLSDSDFGLSTDKQHCVSEKPLDAWMKHLGLPSLSDDLEAWNNASPELIHSFQTLEAWLLKNGVIDYDWDNECLGYAYLGPKDLKLAQILIKGGPEHRKFMRQIFVSVDITAPLYW